MSEVAVCDSACLIALGRIDRAEILACSFDAVFIPPAVQEEIGYSTDWLMVKPVQNISMARALGTQIDKGESEAIALASELGETFVVLDDKKARRVARQLALQVIGTIGVLLRAKKKGIIADVKPILDSLNAADFRIGDSLYQQAMKLAKEE
ncbi:MAG: DUF3368 domain-containing protein [Candidatus Omnitrophota bacterium]|jgi:predicted nucleic acid-binding protein|nr:MAG: DUF3368 domain-containing protein [Candidatus Omnitrophota bacterium]